MHDKINNIILYVQQSPLRIVCWIFVVDFCHLSTHTILSIMEKIFIVFAKENFEAARKIERALTTKASVKLFSIDSSKPLSSLENEVIKENNCKVVLIISDNFLKTEVCMNSALPFIQTLENSKRLLIVSTDGVSTDSFGITKYTPTSFDRVSQVIQYMNFWQEKFLEVRALSRNNDSQLNDKSKVVRNISTEVGEILRLIRPLENFSINVLDQSGYDLLLNKIGKSGELSVVSDEKPILTPQHLPHTTLNGSAYNNGNGSSNGFYTNVNSGERSDVSVENSHFPPQHSPLSTENSLPFTLESLIESKTSPEIVAESIGQNNEIHQNVRLIEHFESSEVHEPVIEHSVESVATINHVPVIAKIEDAVESNITHEPVIEHVVNLNEHESVIEHLAESAPEHRVDAIETMEHVHVKEEPFINEVRTMEENKIEKELELRVESGELSQSALPTLNSQLSTLSERFKYANALVDSKQYDEALEQLDIIIGEDRTFVDAYMLSAYIAEQKGDYSLSQSTLEKVTLLQPNYPGIYFKLGKLTEEYLPKQIKKAGRYYKEAINVEPDNYLAYWSLYKFNQKHNEVSGISNQGSGEHENLISETRNPIADLQHIVSLKPDFADGHFELAQNYLKLGDIVNAHASFNNAAEANPVLRTEENELTFKLPEPIKPKNDNGIIVLITGGTSGIGKATAEHFAKDGYRVIITGRREDRLEDLTKALYETHDNYNLALNFDVRDNTQVEKALGELTEDWRNIDILINNAGLASGLSPIHEGLLSDWEAMIDTNIKGLLYITRCVAPIMVAKNSGHIINICSIAGKEVYPNGNVYCATKAAVDTLKRGMRVDLFKHNIRVSQIAPGMVEDTEFSLVRFHGDAEKANIYSDIKPLNANDVAETIYFMATRPAHVTIQDVLIMPTQQAGANFYNRNGR